MCRTSKRPLPHDLHRTSKHAPLTPAEKKIRAMGFSEYHEYLNHNPTPLNFTPMPTSISTSDEERAPTPPTRPTRQQYQKALTCSPQEWHRRINYIGDLDRFDDEPLKGELIPSSTPYGDLSTVYPLFKQKNFPLGDPTGQGTFEHVLPQLIPAFALCTKLLTEKAVSEPWIHALTGIPTYDTHRKLTYLSPVPSSLNPNAAFAEFQSLLSKLQIKFLFVAFNTPPDPDGPDGQLHGMHHLPHEPILLSEYAILRGNCDIVFLKAMERYHRIAINAAYYEYFLQPKEDRDPKRDLLTLFSLGLTLAHEIYHAWCTRDMVWQSGKTYGEPYYNLSHADSVTATPELGASLEKVLFNAIPQVSIRPRDGAYFTIGDVAVAREGDVVVSLSELHCECMVNMEWVYALMTEKFWSGVKSCKDLHMKAPSSILVRKTLGNRWYWKDLTTRRDRKIARWRTKDHEAVCKVLRKKLRELGK